MEASDQPPTPTDQTLARLRETIRVVAPALAAAKEFWVSTPKGKPTKLKGLGITVTNKIKKGKPGVVVTVESGDVAVSK